MASGIRGSGLMCLRCQRFQARYSDGACKKCHFLILADGVKPDGMRETRHEKTVRSRKQNVRRFNELAKKGLARKQIADEFGWTPEYLSHYMMKMRELDVKPAPLSLRKIIEPQPPVDPPKTVRSNVITEHGGGKGGVCGCNCEKCLFTRRNSHRQRKSTP